MNLLKPISTTLFKFLMFGCGIILIYSFIRFLLNKNIFYFTMTLLSSISFTNVMFNTMLGANIDRYVYPTYPLMIIVFIIMFIDKRQTNSKRRNEK